MKKTNFAFARNGALALVVALALASCKDRTPEEYRQEKVNAELSRLQNVAGTYRGTAVSHADGQTIGLVAVTLRARMKPGSNGDGTSSSGTAVLDGTVTLYNATQASAVIQNAHYYAEPNSDTGTFSGLISVTTRGGVANDLSINGTIRNGVFTGQIIPSGVGPSAGFSLTKDAPFPGGQNLTWPRGNGVLVYGGSFRDTACRDAARGMPNNLCPEGPDAELKVRMTVNLNPPRGEEAFLNNFSYVKIVDVQLAFDESDRPLSLLSLAGAELNQEARNIEFNGMVKEAQISFNCRGHANGGGYRCQLTNSSGLNVKYEFDLLPQPQQDR